MREVCHQVTWMAAQVVALAGGHAQEVRSSGIRPMVVLIKPGKMPKRKKIILNLMICSHLTTFRGQIPRRVAITQTEAEPEPEAMVQMLAILAMDEVSAGTISAVTPIRARVPILAAEIRIGVMTAALVLTETVAQRSPIR